MFLSFLYPYRLRGRVAPYLWVAYKQMTDLAPDEVCFLCSPEYFADPAEYRGQGRFECLWPVNPELGFRVPSARDIARYRGFSVSDRLYSRLKSALVADSLVWRHLIREVEPELVDTVLRTIDTVSRTSPVDGLLTWCNFASLSEAGRRAGIPVIHCELGPLRAPSYRPLGYFDLRGVNGNTEAADRFCALGSAQGSGPELDRESLLRLFALHPSPPPEDSGAFSLGIPLQVEDDSNVLAYGRGFDLPLMVQYGLEAFGRDAILMRPHPGAFLFQDAKGLAVDRSRDSLTFVRRCQGLLTLNSSVAVEAMLAGVPTTVLGESPARLAAGPSLGEMRTATTAELSFLLLNYFVPYELVFDIAYLRWRLTRPSEEAIRARHLQTLELQRLA